MAGRQPEPQRRPSIAATAASLLLLAWSAAPVLAAPGVSARCADMDDASLVIQVHELSAEVVSHDPDVKNAESASESERTDVLSPTHFLAPRAAATMREVFEDAPAPVADAVPPAAAEVTAPERADGDDQPIINTRIPGVSADELARYKRQMYRTDI